jgi:hypothetical protein
VNLISKLAPEKTPSKRARKYTLPSARQSIRSQASAGKRHFHLILVSEFLARAAELPVSNR